MNARKYQTLMDLSVVRSDFRFPLGGDRARINLRSFGDTIGSGVVAFEVSMDGLVYVAPGSGVVALTTLDEPYDVSDAAYPFGRLVVATASGSPCVVEGQVYVYSEA